MQSSSMNCLVTVFVIQLIIAYTYFTSTVAMPSVALCYEKENYTGPEICYEATNITHIARTTKGPGVELCSHDLNGNGEDQCIQVTPPSKVELCAEFPNGTEICFTTTKPPLTTKPEVAPIDYDYYY